MWKGIKNKGKHNRGPCVRMMTFCLDTQDPFSRMGSLRAWGQKWKNNNQNKTLFGLISYIWKEAFWIITISSPNRFWSWGPIISIESNEPRWNITGKKPLLWLDCARLAFVSRFSSQRNDNPSCRHRPFIFFYLFLKLVSCCILVCYRRSCIHAHYLDQCVYQVDFYLFRLLLTEYKWPFWLVT